MNEEELQVLNHIWEQLPLEDKKRLLSEDGWYFPDEKVGN
jgi:hypothetical protein